MRKTSEIVGFTFLALSLATSTDSCPAQGGVTWRQTTPAPSPSPRQFNCMAYDAARQRVVMFGGHDFIRAVSDTWLWDGVNWTQARPAQSPPARHRHAMVYDAARQRVLLFGGYSSSGAHLNDTWVWDGNAWLQKILATSPPARSGHAMAYDAARQRVVLFGGANRNDTWSWDGNAWLQRTPANSPSARSGHAMAYDAVRQQVVLFGGSGLDDTWVWDGNDWLQRIPVSSTTICLGHAMAYDAARQRVVLTKGCGLPTSGSTEEWDGAGWTLSVSGPDRWAQGMAFHDAVGQIVLFGGLWAMTPAGPLTTFSDTLSYASLSPASFTTFGIGCAGSLGDPTLAAAPFSSPWTGDTFSVELGNLPTGSFPVMVLGFTRMSTPIPALPGCTQWSSAEAAVVLTLNGNMATWSQAVPVNPALAGWSLFFQGAALNAGGNNVLGAALSNGGEATIGMR